MDDASKEERFIGDMYLFVGPGTYIPRTEENIKKQIKSRIIKPNTALKMKANNNFTDSLGIARIVGETYIYSKPGAYFEHPYEDMIETIKAHTLTDKQCIQLRANHSFTDVYSKKRKAG